MLCSFRDSNASFMKNMTFIMEGDMWDEQLSVGNRAGTGSTDQQRRGHVGRVDFNKPVQPRVVQLGVAFT